VGQPWGNSRRNCEAGQGGASGPEPTLAWVWPRSRHAGQRGEARDRPRDGVDSPAPGWTVAYMRGFNSLHFRRARRLLGVGAPSVMVDILSALRELSSRSEQGQRPTPARRKDPQLKWVLPTGRPGTMRHNWSRRSENDPLAV
jgi:hypothetical protein